MLFSSCDFASKSWKISKEIGDSQLLTQSLNSERMLREVQVQSQEFRWDPHWKEIFRELLTRCNQALKLVENDDYQPEP